VTTAGEAPVDFVPGIGKTMLAFGPDAEIPTALSRFTERSIGETSVCMSSCHTSAPLVMVYSANGLWLERGE
jgi:hypothetical protein